MIGSFWNLCRACPSMPVDKFHSEYRSTYRWHEYTGGSRPEVIRKPPVTNQFASNADHFFSKSTEDERHVEASSFGEPPLPRRKKCPELAYKTHEFIARDGDLRATAPSRARSEERGTPSRRSKSEGPHRIPNGQVYPVGGDVVDAAGNNCNGGPAQAGESSGLFRKTISKLSTEYRIQFIWPYTRTKGNNSNDDVVDYPRKSISMGAIRTSNAMPTVHQKRTVPEKEATVQELEPLCPDEKPEKREAIIKKTSARPFSQYANEIKYKNAHTERENFGFANGKSTDNKTITNGLQSQTSWYRDVVELRKQAELYKNRGWGIEMNPDLFVKQKDLWEQVSRRSSLSALSLASSVHKPITKAEKDAANNRKTSPSKAFNKGNALSHVQFIDNKLINDSQHRALNIRHHLGRTTGLDLEDGGLLPSPTREKLMPAITKRDDESYNSQRGSPKKSVTSRHGSPQKGSPQKQAKKPIKQTKARSQSVGPISTTEGSPKRQARSGSAVPSATTITSNKTQKKTPVSTPTIVERRPRPTSLSTTNHYRSKSSSIPPTGRALSAPGNHHIPPNITNQLHNSIITNETQPRKLSPSNLTIPLRKTFRPAKHQRPQSAIVMGNFDPMTASTIIFNEPHKTKGLDRKTGGNDDDTDRDGVASISSASPLPAYEIYEHIVKSPPEPTRVKSPEQIIMRSPDPVNWIVPLDTGKTFTVTQNVREGDPIIRPQSELKAATPVDKPPLPPSSAPPQLPQQTKIEILKTDIPKEDTTKTVIDTSIANLSASIYEKPIPGSTLRCLDDPSFEPNINSPAAKQNVAASESLDKAHDRFDRFWANTNQQP